MDAHSPHIIFVVDDDQGLVRLIDKSLRREGFATASAGSGRDAIAWLTKNVADLLLLDLKLQDMEGKEVMAHLNLINRAPPFIVISGQGDERVAVEMMKQGATDYLVKDADFLEFVPAVVKRALKEIEKEQKLAASDANRKRLEEEVLRISELEQRRIGQDLHDGLCQQLAGIELMSQALEQSLTKKAKKEAAQAAKIAEYVRESISQTRMLARGLSPVELETNGLMSALEELASNTEKLFGVVCHFRCESPVLIHDNAVATHLYRITQEAVSNAIKHGKAGQVEISLTTDAEKIILSVKDNGRGLPKNLSNQKGMGLRIMQYRAGMIDGALTIRKRSEGGTIVACSISRQLPASHVTKS